MPDRRDDGTFPYEEGLDEAGQIEPDPDEDPDFDPTDILNDAEQEDPLPDDLSLT
jgi:hypothetical protein